MLAGFVSGGHRWAWILFKIINCRISIIRFLILLKLLRLTDMCVCVCIYVCVFAWMYVCVYVCKRTRYLNGHSYSNSPLFLRTQYRLFIFNSLGNHRFRYIIVICITSYSCTWNIRTVRNREWTFSKAFNRPKRVFSDCDIVRKFWKLFLWCAKFPIGNLKYNC
jgi:hypothetical protein